MYCSSCGGVVTEGLTYCKHCGAKLNGTKGESRNKPTELSPNLLIPAMVAVFVLGTFSLSLLMLIMKRLGFNEGMINGIVMMTFMMMLILEGTFIWLLASRRRGHQRVAEIEQSKEHTTKELDAAQVRALPEPVPSVTEHTTRTLDHTFSDRRSN
ncbi:MAG TPA: hypothetical protein VF779_15225 [Pyrinomonadaceae bacterium]